MALHSKKDFSVLCGIPTRSISTYASRNKIVLSGDYIDDSIQLNKDFIAKRQLMAGKAPVTAASEEKAVKQLRMIRPDPGIVEPPNVKDPEIDDDDFNDDDEIQEPITTLTKRKVAVDIAKKREEIEILKVRKDKLHGVLIPTDLVKVVFTQHSKSILTEFSNSIDNILTIFRKKKDLNANEVAEIRGELLQSINTAVSKSNSRSKKEISNIQNEFTVKREVGERS